jgi:hypothetical protein
MAILGWSEDERSTARQMDESLLRLGLSLKFPEMIINSGMPEGQALAKGDQVLWQRHTEVLSSEIEVVEDRTRAFQSAIGN